MLQWVKLGSSTVYFTTNSRTYVVYSGLHSCDILLSVCGSENAKAALEWSIVLYHNILIVNLKENVNVIIMILVMDKLTSGYLPGHEK